MQQEKKSDEGKHEDPPLVSLNHVSRLCRNLDRSIHFYTTVLGFVETERPEAVQGQGSWLFNYGIGVHLIQSQSHDHHKLPHASQLDPKDNHISFQCEDMEAMEKRLKDMNVRYKKRDMEDQERGTKIDQLFFNDPDGFMIEICNCENLKLVPAASLGKLKLPLDRHNPPLHLHQSHSK